MQAVAWHAMPRPAIARVAHARSLSTDVVRGDREFARTLDGFNARSTSDGAQIAGIDELSSPAGGDQRPSRFPARRRRARSRTPPVARMTPHKPHHTTFTTPLRRHLRHPHVPALFRGRRQYESSAALQRKSITPLEALGYYDTRTPGRNAPDVVPNRCGLRMGTAISSALAAPRGDRASTGPANAAHHAHQRLAALRRRSSASLPMGRALAHRRVHATGVSNLCLQLSTTSRGVRGFARAAAPAACAGCLGRDPCSTTRLFAHADARHNSARSCRAHSATRVHAASCPG